MNSFRARHVMGDVRGAAGSAEARPIKAALVAQSPVNKIIQGDSPWHGNRENKDPRSAWHNARGTRGHVMLYGDSHAQFYKFPAEMEDPKLDTLFVTDDDTKNPLGPNPAFYWW